MNIRETIRDLKEQLLAQLHEAANLKQKMGSGNTKALSQFLRPNVPPALAPWRRLLEPVVAFVAIFALMTLLVTGAISFAVFLAAAGAMYGIIKHVFGVDFALDPQNL